MNQLLYKNKDIKKYNLNQENIQTIDPWDFENNFIKYWFSIDFIERFLLDFLRSNHQNSFFQKKAFVFPKCCIFAAANERPL